MAHSESSSSLRIARDFRMIPMFISKEYKFSLLGSEQFVSPFTIELTIDSSSRTLDIKTSVGVQLYGIY